jgi:diguanylate cyclase (GGDEF)-like protein
MSKATFRPEQFIILIVDDTKSNRQIVETILRKAGYHIVVADSGKTALDIVGNNHRIDLIILDLVMPEINGLQVCEIIRENLKLRDIPIIFLTASNDQEYLLQAFEIGAVDYIYMPCNALELLARVKNHLELKNTRDQLKEALIELKKLAATDELTGLPNRREIITQAEREFARVKRHGGELSILIIDIDHFKKINDNYGHDIGDEAIKVMANNASNCVRKDDVFGRFGGEEFVALLPCSNTEGALIVAERIRESIANNPLDLDGTTITLTVSVGATTYRKDDHSINDMLKRADQALYQAKNLGRDRVISHP